VSNPGSFLVVNTRLQGNMRVGVNYRFGGPVVAKY